MSGVAATLIHGETTHMSMGLNRLTITSEMIEAWSDTRLVIVDECSFASTDQVDKMEQHACILKNQAFQYYGGLNIVFACDFSQLEPPCTEPLYCSKKKYCTSFHGLLNAFIELDGCHRFRHDPNYGVIMRPRQCESFHEWRKKNVTYERYSIPTCQQWNHDWTQESRMYSSKPMFLNATRRYKFVMPTDLLKAYLIGPMQRHLTQGKSDVLNQSSHLLF
jgi:hypothetical protein